ncbi:MAG TPA: DUF1152 domain-containing protein [Thermodesulfobacteriota bacterium]|nr:DUF1152 domain-containing protein [Thermodesulfobacteriota bacterium]
MDIAQAENIMVSENRSLESILKKSKRAIIIGIGGGGDIVGTIPTARLLDMFGIDCILGGLPWERSVFDPIPGPRVFGEIKNLRPLNDTVWFANKDTVTATGVRFAETEMAEIYEKEMLLVDITKGVVGVVKGLDKAMSELNADLLIGIDVGGDSIGFGDEKGLASPLADAIMTTSLSELSGKYDTLLGLFGYGSDGELTPDELERSLSLISREGGFLGAWGITTEILREMEMVISKIPTEASRIPVECAKGERGEKYIRSETRKVYLSTASTVTFYLSPVVVVEKVSKPARLVLGSKSLDEANEALHSIGLFTELDLERERERSGAKN